MITGNCHCGAISWVLRHSPPHLVRCTCSLCHRYGVIWGHATHETVQVSVRDGHDMTYVHGDKLIDFHFCGSCGCITHYTSRSGQAASDRVSVNMRMADPAVLDRFRIRTFDGARTWAYLDDDPGGD